MRFKKVFFLFMLPFNKEDWIRYDMEFLESKGIQPYYMDLSNLFFNKPIERPTTPELFPYLKTFSSKNELKQFLIENREDSILALDLPLRSKTTWLYRMITSVDISYVGLNTRWFPRGLRNRNKRVQLKKVNLSYLKNKIKFEIEYQLFRKFVRKADAVFIPNNRSKKLDPVCNSRTLRYYSHSSDYDQTMRSKGEVSDDYIVFIDVYYPHHPDLKLYGLQTGESSDKYHKSMNALFKKLEQLTGKQVVICAHPRRKKDLKSEFDFPMVYNQTSEYIKKAALVINHYSTAINYVVIFKKPMLMVTMDAFEVNGSDRSIEIVSNRLGSKIINGNHVTLEELEEGHKDYIEIDKESYQSFLYENIIHENSKGYRFGEELLTALKRISQRKEKDSLNPKLN